LKVKYNNSRRKHISSDEENSLKNNNYNVHNCLKENWQNKTFKRVKLALVKRFLAKPKFLY